ncbi:hypothetical protein [Bordetella genomosp. 13]|uniref:hypothetical protein n=1 Tax=Bordetella genomosp. 13 TaxID=463040 RepID=UPI0011A3B204|nr:hypothetical protein [Bordetella genomosp. 13]
MSSPELTLRQFGQAAGFDDLSFDARGHAVLQAGSGRQIGVERTAGRDVMVYLTHPLDYDAGAWLLRAWKRAHHSRLEDWPVQAALRESPDGQRRLVALVRVPESEFTTLRLNQALETLSRWMDAVRDDAY